MGGGQSTSALMGEIIAATYVIGRAIATTTFPGMYRIYDFHSSKAPKIMAVNPSFNFYADSDEEIDEDEPDESEYAHMFHVHVGEDTIYIENPIEVNEAGWTPLHACCMSFLTVQAGLALVDETERLGGDLNAKTTFGPGTYSKGWTALHMAAAYGIEPLVKRLIQAGVETHTVNSQGFTPLLEACHRGFLPIVSCLVSTSGIPLDYIPPQELFSASPYARAPSQSALAEAARNGFTPVVQCLLDAGASKDQVNEIGWTALHEACFYNRIDVVKLLLLNGANAVIRTTFTGALPYHLAGLHMVRKMIEDMGGPGSVPDDDDQVDMAAVMKDLTIPQKQVPSGTNNSNISNSGSSRPGVTSGSSSANVSATPTQRLQRQLSGGSSALSAKPSPLSQSSTSNTLKTPPSAKSSSRGAAAESEEAVFLHNGPMLGELPSLAPKKSPSKTGGGGSTGLPSGHELEEAIGGGTPSSGKKSRSKLKKQSLEKPAVPKDTPPQYLCCLCQLVLTDPVRSIYGHVYERSVIQRWMTEQGRICPMTGQPLAENDLEADNALKGEITQWILQRGSEPSKGPTTPTVASSKRSTTVSTSKAVAVAPTSAGSLTTASNCNIEDDMYDF